jgi:hypothetical protein
MCFSYAAFANNEDRLPASFIGGTERVGERLQLARSAD